MLFINSTSEFMFLLAFKKVIGSNPICMAQRPQRLPDLAGPLLLPSGVGGEQFTLLPAGRAPSSANCINKQGNAQSCLKIINFTKKHATREKMTLSNASFHFLQKRALKKLKKQKKPSPA